MQITMNMENKLFIVLKDEEGIFRPMAFITQLDEIGKIRAEEYKEHKLDDGEELVVVEMKEIIANAE